ncbi:MAG: type IV-A pilus assembly ATPase PilB [Neisseriaceae bacterium]|nr:type IV-A pilus assembly ATPase PilB [Neisseriaceae bacterium]
MSQNNITLSGLARALMQHDLITKEQAFAATERALSERTTFIDELLAAKYISSFKLANFLSVAFQLPLLDLDNYNFANIPREILEGPLMVDRALIPLEKKNNTLFLATSDPTMMAEFQAITFKTDLKIDLIIVEHDKLMRALELVKQSEVDILFKSLDNDDLEGISTDGELEENGGDIEDAPVVKFIHKILVDAIAAGTSDVHFEPYEKFYRIRFRKDGGLQEITRPPLLLRDKISARVKVMARLDISERRIPQDGRIKLKISRDKSVDFRVSILPTLFGEKIVMRILDSTAASLNIDALGFEPEQKELLLKNIVRPYGMVLVTGPTGSGKTVSLYTAINILNTPDSNIATAEDPVEINLEGINQVNINDKQGLTFSAALKSFLRQDPDIILVGEIRDYETADIAIKAAQTGHMVFSTLHTNDAPSTLTRLLNMGIAPFNVASSVLLIMAQRLGRRLCQCKKPIELPRETLLEAGFLESDLDGSWQLYGPNGCDICGGSGYKGRVGIYELMPITDGITRLILTNANAAQIGDLALSEGMIDLRRSGLLKVKAGIMSLVEVEALTNQ